MSHSTAPSSTAAPKGVVHTHASMLHGADSVADRLGLDAEDVTYGYLPLFFNGGLVGVALAPLSRGGAIVLQEVFEADETLRLSDLTLPHAFVRVLLAEALYRAWTVTVNHPYHRE